MKKYTFYLFALLLGFTACKKEESISVSESEILGQWASISGYPDNYLLDIHNVNGNPSPDIFLLKGNVLYWEPAPLEKHTFIITKFEGDIMIVNEGNNNDISFKKIKDY